MLRTRLQRIEKLINEKADDRTSSQQVDDIGVHTPERRQRLLTEIGGRSKALPVFDWNTPLEQPFLDMIRQRIVRLRQPKHTAAR